MDFCLNVYRNNINNKKKKACDFFLFGRLLLHQILFNCDLFVANISKMATLLANLECKWAFANCDDFVYFLLGLFIHCMDMYNCIYISSVYICVCLCVIKINQKPINFVDSEILYH